MINKGSNIPEQSTIPPMPSVKLTKNDYSLILRSVAKPNSTFGILGTPCKMKDSYSCDLFVGDVVYVEYEKAAWSKLCLVCNREPFGDYIPLVPHIRNEDSKDFLIRKVIDYSFLRKGFRLNSLYVDVLKEAV